MSLGTEVDWHMEIDCSLVKLLVKPILANHMMHFAVIVDPPVNLLKHG